MRMSEDLRLADLELPKTDDYRFSDWIESTAELQARFFEGDPADFNQEEVIQFLIWNSFAVEDELHEMMQEIGWKPWATSNHINREAALKEMVDLLHFVGNILRALRVTGKELTIAYKAKQFKNAMRQVDGYDGVKDKCGECGREK